MATRIRRGTQPIQTPPYQHSPGIGTQPTASVTGPVAGVQPSTPAQTAQAAHLFGAQADALTQYVNGITDPQERAYVLAQIGPQITALKAQQAALLQQSQQEQAAIQGFTQALLDQMKGLAAGVGTPYAQIAGIQVGSGKAEGQGLANVGGGVNDANQAILQAIGAPNSQQAALAKLEGDVFGTGGQVLAGTGGSVPAFATQGTGLGVLGWAAAQPTIAASYGQDAMRQLLAGFARQQADVNSQITQVVSGIPKIRSDYQAGLADQKKAEEDRAMSLYNAGMLTQRQLAQALGLPNANSYPNATRGSSSAPIVTTGANGHRLIIDRTTGKITDLGPTTAPRGAGASGPPKTFGSASSGYYVWQQTPTGWKAVRITAPTAGGRTGHPTTVRLPNGDLAVWQRKGNSWSLATIAMKGTDPTKPTITGPGGVPLTNSNINDYGATVVKSITSARRQGIPITKVIDTFEREGIPSQIYLPILMRRYGIARNLNPANLKNMSVQRLFRTAAVLGYRPPTAGSQTTYYGTDGLGNKRALTNDEVKAAKGGNYPGWMVGTTITQSRSPGHPGGGLNKNELVSWIQSHLPKDDAAAQAAIRLPANASSQFATVDAEGAPDASGVKHHAAYDWMLGAGSAVPALAGGTVVEVSPYRGNSGQVFGSTVKIQMANGQVLVYRHVAPAVKVGQKIAAGQQVAKVVRWADNPGSSHTHVELWKTRQGGYNYGNMLDPLQEFGGSSAVAGAGAPAQQVALANRFGRQYGVDPNVLLAIAGHETGFGTLGQGRNGYTLGFGATDSGTISKYRGVANQYRYAAQLLARWGVHTIQDILAGKASRYATDPNWERGVASVYQGLV